MSFLDRFPATFPKPAARRLPLILAAMTWFTIPLPAASRWEKIPAKGKADEGTYRFIPYEKLGPVVDLPTSGSFCIGPRLAGVIFTMALSRTEGLVSAVNCSETTGALCSIAGDTVTIQLEPNAPKPDGPCYFGFGADTHLSVNTTSKTVEFLEVGE